MYPLITASLGHVKFCHTKIRKFSIRAAYTDLYVHSVDLLSISVYRRCHAILFHTSLLGIGSPVYYRKIVNTHSFEPSVSFT